MALLEDQIHEVLTYDRARALHFRRRGPRPHRYVTSSVIRGQLTFSMTCGNAFRGMGSTRGRFLTLLSMISTFIQLRRMGWHTLTKMLMAQRLLLRQHLPNLGGLQWAH